MKLELIGLGIVFFVLAYMVGVKKQTWLLAGFNEKRVTDKDKLAKLTGSYNIVVGIGLIIAGILNSPVGEGLILVIIAGYVALLIYVNVKMVR